MSEFDPESEDFAFRKPPLEEVKQALLQEAESSSEIIPSIVIYGLSDLSLEERRAVEAIWGDLPSACKHRVLRALNNASQSMFELNFRAIAFLALSDESSEVRAKAVELLWTDESAETMRQLISLAECDSDNGVKSSALESLGRFLLLGEYGDMPAELALKAQELTLKLHKDKSESARRPSARP